MILNRTLVLLAVALPAYGQLYLLTGSPTGNLAESYAASLFRVEGDSVRQVGEDLIRQATGAEWFAVSYDWRKVVIRSRDAKDDKTSNSVTVIDFDKAPAMKRCKVPDTNMALIYSWLGDTPAGPSYEWFEGGDDPYKDIAVKGMLLDTSLPCKESFAPLSPDAVQGMVADGYPGVANSAMGTSVFAMVENDDPKGNVAVGMPGMRIRLGYQIPEEFRRGLEIRVTNILVSDSHAFAVTFGSGRTDYRILVFRKSDKTWHNFPIHTEVAPNVRGFGRYLATAEVRLSRPGNSSSAGSANWRSDTGKMGPDISGRIALLNEVYPGKLYLYDVDTGNVLTMVTNDGNSEVLLVENSTVYYRADNRLYVASIDGDQVSPGRLLATADAVRDAHWAFFKH